MENILNHIDSRKDTYIEDLKALIRVPSISSSPEHKPYMLEMAQTIESEMTSIGLENIKIVPTKGHPVVYGDWLHAEGKPTILIYGHYDVMPVDPLELWDSPPFEPEIRNNRMWGRGVADDKGQFFIHLKAIEAWLSNEKSLPVNIKVIIEGEEEMGSVHLDAFLEENKDMLGCDYIIISDTAMFAEGYPSITYGIRGLATAQLNLRGTNSDLHSGSFGGLVKNPIHALAEIIAKLKDDDGHIAIPGFYDDVLEVTDKEHKALGKLPFDEENFRASIDAPALYGENGYSRLEQLWARPTLDVNGIWGGYQGEGSKTVIPAEAHAKISMRLVANQNPDKIVELLASYIKTIAPKEVDVDIESMHGGFGYLTPLDEPALVKVENALKAGFNTEVSYIREGGSIPIVKTMSDLLDATTLLIGFGLPDENAHAPNENFDLDNFHNGIRSIALLFKEMAML